MLENPFSYSLGFTSFTCIVFTHNSLKLREFIYHLCDQVKFAYFRGAIDSLGGSTIHFKEIRQLLRVATNTTDLVSHRSKLLMEYDALKLGKCVLNRHFLIFFIEEFRIR
ncbi:hypothetical protein D3C73_1368980 [compost metagenome]